MDDIVLHMEFETRKLQKKLSKEDKERLKELATKFRDKVKYFYKQGDEYLRRFT